MSALSRIIAVLGMLMLAHSAGAQCSFDARGTITNPNDTSCRDVRFDIRGSDVGGDIITLGYPVPVPVDSLEAVAGFRRYESLHAQHQALFVASDNVDARQVGQTLAGRTIWAYVLGDADQVTPEGFAEPAMLLNGGIHAREWQSPEAVTEVLEQLVETANDGGLGQYLADNTTIVIVPVLNIDGFEQTQRFPDLVAAARQQPRDGRMRRKNLRRPGGGLVDDDMATSADQFDGVDLNRNSIHGFGLNDGSSSNTVSLVYRGSAAASEPEIQALQAAADLGPANRLRFYVDAHSFTRQFFVPSTSNLRRNVLTNALAQRLSAATFGRYAISMDPVGAEIGVTADYFAIEYQIPSWTLEIEPRSGGQEYGGTGASHSGFVLPDAEVPRMRDEVTSMLLLGYYRQSGPPSVKAVQISRVDNGDVVYRADWVADAANAARSLSVSVDEPLEAGASHQLWVAFNKPMRVGDGAGMAAQYTGQTPPELGSVSLDEGAEDADGQTTLNGGLQDWLGTPGGAPDGYDTYAFDAFLLTFDAPAVTSGVNVALSLDVQDLSMQALDADPRTPVDWSSGRWSGYEDEFGEDNLDVGGTDCQVTVRVAPAGTTAPASTAVACKASFVAPPTPPAPTPVAPSNSGGGGGTAGPLHILFLAFVALMGFARRQRG